MFKRLYWNLKKLSGCHGVWLVGFCSLNGCSHISNAQVTSNKTALIFWTPFPNTVINEWRLQVSAKNKFFFVSYSKSGLKNTHGCVRKYGVLKNCVISLRLKSVLSLKWCELPHREVKIENQKLEKGWLMIEEHVTIRPLPNEKAILAFLHHQSHHKLSVVVAKIYKLASRMV